MGTGFEACHPEPSRGSSALPAWLPEQNNRRLKLCGSLAFCSSAGTVCKFLTWPELCLCPRRIMPDRRYQTIGARFVASVIDTIVFLPLILAWYLIDPIEILQWLLGCGMFVVSTAYFVLFHGRDGQTLGKRLMNVRVVRANDEYRISYRQSMWRESPWITINAALLTIEAISIFPGSYGHSTTLGATYDAINALSYGWIICDSATALLTTKRRSLHDLIGGTVVVREN